jgi:pimeloyl-ACP methyl ester carboxylesterase
MRIFVPESTCLLFLVNSLRYICGSTGLNVYGQLRAPPVVILPGFGNDMIDYINPQGRGISSGFVAALERRGIPTTVLPIKRTSWLNIARGALSKNFWTYECSPQELFGFYLSAVDRTVRRVVEDNGGPCVLAGHSAGGWLARACLADGMWCGSTTASSDLVAGLVTLGSPHSPPITEKTSSIEISESGTKDMTRGALTYVHNRYPGAFLSKKNIFYLSVAGTAVTSDLAGSTAEKFAADSYPLVSGSNKLNQIGDGVVPITNAHLAGAVQITLPGIIY